MISVQSNIVVHVIRSDGHVLPVLHEFHLHTTLLGSELYTEGQVHDPKDVVSVRLLGIDEKFPETLVQRRIKECQVVPADLQRNETAFAVVRMNA